MAFSGAVKLSGIDDYLAPSQNCIKPLIDKKKEEMKEEEKNASGKVTIAMEVDDLDAGHFNQINTKEGEKAALTLNDCLACSGCVTSAETMLITQQSTKEFLSNLAPDARKKLVVVSVSPQSRTSLAAHFKLTALQLAKRLTTFFKGIGVNYVLDTTCSQDISLLEARAEFARRFQETPATLPVMTSECPGWICYAEKTQGTSVLPYISGVRSPQQVMGAIVKRLLATKAGVASTEVYHACVMPCYDKKLEGSRMEFFDEEQNIRDVDCVISTGELRDLLQEREVDLNNLADAPLDMLNSVNADQTMLLSARGTGGSGGYAEDVFRWACQSLFQVEPPETLNWKQGRNPDFHEVSLERDGKPVLRFARAYGFRNIQNLMRTIKRKKCLYHYVEVMACPSGCLNGGGQIKADSITKQKQLVVELDGLFHDRQVRAPEANPVVREVYAEMVKGDIGSDAAKKCFHTEYRAIEKVEVTNPLAIQW